MTSRRASSRSSLPPEPYECELSSGTKPGGRPIELAEQALASEHNNLRALLHLTSLHARAGRDAGAREAATDVLRLAPNFTVALAGKWRQTRDETFAAVFAEGLRKADLPE
ncbi:MAG: hypothetical protein OEQ29_22175 [Alphaproteobacteria bacterium]|nr:hypothetical protein [Alphaproteobacteria bacterium]